MLSSYLIQVRPPSRLLSDLAHYEHGVPYKLRSRIPRSFHICSTFVYCDLACPAGLEPATYGLEDRCSNPTELRAE
jgi:hypothetical protein